MVNDMLAIWAKSYLIASGMESFAAAGQRPTPIRDEMPPYDSAMGRTEPRRPLTGITRLIERWR